MLLWVHLISKCCLVLLSGAYYIAPTYFSRDGYPNHPELLPNLYKQYYSKYPHTCPLTGPCKNLFECIFRR